MKGLAKIILKDGREILTSDQELLNRVIHHNELKTVEFVTPDVHTYSQVVDKLAQAIFNISENLVQVSKSHITESKCISNIRKELNILNDDSVYDLLRGNSNE